MREALVLVAAIALALVGMGAMASSEEASSQRNHRSANWWAFGSFVLMFLSIAVARYL